jgi:hypothetical protein
VDRVRIPVHGLVHGGGTTGPAKYDAEIREILNARSCRRVGGAQRGTSIVAAFGGVAGGVRNGGVRDDRWLGS